MKIHNHRFLTLDGMRGIAALAVMAMHLSQHTSVKIFSGAALAVDLFFCLSGFVIAYSYIPRLNNQMSFIEFIGKRLIRLYPMFLCGFVLGSFSLIAKVYLNQTNLSFAEAIFSVLLNLIYLPYFSDFYIEIGNDRIPSAIFPTNDPSWSLFFELLANIIFAVIAIYFRKFHFFILAVIGFTGIFLYAIYARGVAPGWGAYNFFGGLPRVLYGFFSGVLVYFIYNKFKYKIPVFRSELLMIFILILLYKGGAYWLVSTLFLVPLLVLLGSVSTSTSKKNIKRYEYLGWISYPVYCIHFPVYSLFTIVTGNADYGIWAFIFCAPVTIVLSHYLTVFIEEPVRSSLSAKIFNKK